MYTYISSVSEALGVLRLYVHIFVILCTYVSVYIYTHTYLYIHIYIYIYIYIHVCVYICIYKNQYDGIVSRLDINTPVFCRVLQGVAGC